MKNKTIINFILAAVLSPLLVSCFGSLLEPKADQTEFYIMNSSQNVGKVKVEGKVSINLLPITTPSYMTRNQIVSEGEGGAVVLSEFDRWAESAQNGFTRSLVCDLASASDNISVYAYPSFGPDALNLRVFIYDCIGKIGGNLRFVGKWQIDSESDSASHFAKDFSFTVPCGGACADYVKAMDECVYKLSREIVEYISKTQKTGKKQ